MLLRLFLFQNLCYNCFDGNIIKILCLTIFILLSVDLAGDIGPFQLAIFLTIVSLFIILTWEESRGDNAADNHVRVVHENEDENIQRDAFIRNGKRAPRLRERQESNTEVTTANNKTDSEETPLQAFITSMKDTVKYMVVRPPIMCLGLSQAFFEGGVFTFGKQSVSFEL